MGCGASSRSYKEPRQIPTKHFPDFEKALPSLEGKVFAITGCTTGTGFVAARCAARKGAHVVMLNRKSQRSVDAEKRLGEEVPGAKLTSVECDLMSFDSVRKAAEVVKGQFSDTGIDILCNNAGVMAWADEATSDGYDVQMQTNHLSHFLLTRELFPLLEKAAELRGEARIVNHSSLARNGKKLESRYLGKNGGNLGGNGSSMFCGGARWQRYHQTKLANVIFTLALNDKLKAGASKVKALCAAPGLAATNLQVTTNQNDGMSSTWIMKYGQSAEDGTMPLLQCCLGQDAQSGSFIEPAGTGGMKGLPKQIMKLNRECTDIPSRQTLWALSEQACGEFKLGA
eukprot:TRINITY_DN37247_c0_g1_i1.p1 TRINITY_DN37247_c0_g1~~TRINITY_DN37247_c0_g1_i1.p1  ORF type:complete len:367 (+),score=67.37 TRINITY_DN37247_c0_g1_i1:77-1102(+)